MEVAVRAGDSGAAHDGPPPPRRRRGVVADSQHDFVRRCTKELGGGATAPSGIDAHEIRAAGTVVTVRFSARKQAPTASLRNPSGCRPAIRDAWLRFV